MADLLTRGALGTEPIDLATAKAHLKVTSTADDSLITALVTAVVDFVESYTGRQYRTGTAWTLLLDDFDDRMCIRVSPVAVITAVEYLLAGVWTTVPTSTYYLKRSATWSEVLLADGQAWPDDADTIEHRVRVSFTAGPHTESLQTAKAGMLRLLAAAYDDRGDCEPLVNAGMTSFPLAMMNDLTRKSGAAMFLAQHRIPRF